MSVAVVLDSGPVGLYCHPHHVTQAVVCRRWITALQAAGRQVVLPEIVDYEVRRELIRLNSTLGLLLLEQLGRKVRYLNLDTVVMRVAASRWALARNTGQQTAPDDTLDPDVILAAQALSLGSPVVVATSNPGHLTRYVAADLWSNIKP